jgi:dolichol-phosphate mannosyltransferase
MKISTVVPFLNEQENLPVLYDRLKTVFDSREETAEFLFIDDGSTDGSFQCLEKLRVADPRIRILQFSRNFGHQAAISAGIDHASGDAVIIMDADLQDPPEVIPDLLAQWHEGIEVVYAVRRRRAGEGFFKKVLAATFYRVFQHLCSVKVPVDAGDFRLLDRVVVDALKTMRETHRYMRGMTSWVGFRQCAVEYDRAARLAGETKYPVWKSLKLAWDGLTSFSGAPLRFVAALGLGTFLLGILWLLKILITRLLHPSLQVSGWASVMVAVLLLGGVQLLSVGVLGQYLSRTFEESKKRPLYILRPETDG